MLIVAASVPVDGRMHRSRTVTVGDEDAARERVQP